MRTTLITFLLLTGIIGSNLLHAQGCVGVDSIKVIPSNPKPNDTIHIIMHWWTCKLSVKSNMGWDRSGDTFSLKTCYYLSPADAFSFHDDTFKLGQIPYTGRYFIKFTAFGSSFEGNCIYPSKPKVDTFYVAPVLSFHPSDEDYLEIDLYPNPSYGPQAITVHTRKPGQVEITLLDLSGRTVSNIFNGYIADVWQGNIALSHLQSGCYLLRVKTETEYRIIKVFRQ